jgi:predicted dehydrogenase
MDRVRLGVIGAGFMGGLHARAAHESHLAEVVAVADIDAGRAEALATNYGGKTYTGVQEMLERESLDAVVVTTPENDHRQAVVMAAEKGCHVFVEKPIAASLADADAMISACNAAKVKLMVGYILRFEPAYVKIKEAVAAGTMGTLMSAYGRRNAPIQEARRLCGRCSVINYLTVHDADQILWYNEGHQVKKVVAKAIKGKVFEERLGPY